MKGLKLQKKVAVVTGQDKAGGGSLSEAKSSGFQQFGAGASQKAEYLGEGEAGPTRLRSLIPFHVGDGGPGRQVAAVALALVSEPPREQKES